MGRMGRKISITEQILILANISIFHKILAIILSIGLITLLITNFAAVFYIIYLWGSVGLALSTSVWSGVVLWLKMFLSGIVIVGISGALLVSIGGK